MRKIDAHMNDKLLHFKLYYLLRNISLPLGVVIVGFNCRYVSISQLSNLAKHVTWLAKP